ncbi:MAG: glycosyltransferase family 4 protein [Clostridiaceae bacterium]|nr:glycosyltransferase family 4 protein [Clostridiaceae bacterium]
MRKVLMIAHQFPPIGGSGVQRTVKFVKYLPEFGYTCIVLTRQAKNVQLTDDTLYLDIPAETVIYRTKAWDLSEWFFPLNLAGKFIRRRILIPDGERLWERFSVRKAKQIVKDENIKILYSTSQPFSTHLLALEIKKEYPEIPWVADFRDEWTNNAFVKAYNYNPVRIGIEKRMERRVFEMADAVVINTPFMRDNSVRDNPDLGYKFHVIPNGFDKEDFEGIDEGEPNDKFTLTYTGLIYGNTSPETVFKAISALLDENKLDREKIKLRFVGRFKESKLIQMAKEHGVLEILEITPYQSHKESVKKLMMSDALLLLLGKGTDAIYTGKLMEYINTGKPILASVPAKGAAAALVTETGTGFVADCDDVETTARHIQTLYDSWLAGKKPISPNKELISRFERRELTKELAEVFNSLCRG